MPVRFREAALADLDEIFDYSFRQFGLDTALEYRDGLHRVFAMLEGNPRLAPIVDWFGRDLRSFPFKSHRVYFRIEHSDVVIARILHHARDSRDQLKS